MMIWSINPSSYPSGHSKDQGHNMLMPSLKCAVSEQRQQHTKLSVALFSSMHPTFGHTILLN